MFFLTLPVPGDSSSWIVLDSNGASGGKEQKIPEVTKAESTKMDIFSQAMASAEIGDFAATNSSKCCVFH